LNEGDVCLLKQKTKVEEILIESSESSPVISVGENNSVFSSLVTSLAEIRKLKGVLGYILRSNTSAIIDLAEQEKIIEYATLLSQIAESTNEMAKQFNLAEIESVLVEGKSVKVLFMSIGDNKIGIFMERTATHAGIIKRILL
jgi:predicted regulator of Ras-like GTPase activity (Roadblock/LC7/MglB family)